MSSLNKIAFLRLGLYIYPFLALCVFVFFLWYRKTGRLKTKPGKFVSYLPILLLLAGVLFIALFIDTVIFGPITSSMGEVYSYAPVLSMPAQPPAATAGTSANILSYSPSYSDKTATSPMDRLYTEMPRAFPAPADTARYSEYRDNAAVRVRQEPLSTFGLDVSTASYANVRRFLNAGRFPETGAVRVEEMLNYFPALPEETRLESISGAPFRAACQLAPCPWDANKTLLWVSVIAAELDYNEAPPASLVFLVDVSGSMNPPERLPLVKSSLKLLADSLRPQDKVSLVTYANGSQVTLKPTSGSEKSAILTAIDQLTSGGGTAGSQGIQLAYEQAQEAFIEGGVNRIILCTDGDFNIGVTDEEALKAMLSRKRGRNVTLSILGYGTDNLNDSMMVKIASAGNGNYSYIDTLSEAQKVLGEEMASTLVVVAKDAKVQIEFNPDVVAEYRQIGYEKRQLNAEDFNDDKVDAGDVGAGKRVTVLYELTLVGQKSSVDPLRYGETSVAETSIASADADSANAKNKDELAYLKLRWKKPDENESSLAEFPIFTKAIVPTFEEADSSLRFSAAVAAFGQKLRGSSQLLDTPWDAVASWAENAKGSDKGGYRAELARLIGLAKSLEDR